MARLWCPNDSLIISVEIPFYFKQVAKLCPTT